MWKISFDYLDTPFWPVHHDKDFCQQKGKGDWTTEELKGLTNDLDWFVDGGNGVCNIGNNGGIGACAKICQDINGCRYFSVSTANPCYACFIYKNCNDPFDVPKIDYKIFEIQKGEYKHSCKKMKECT